MVREVRRGTSLAGIVSPVTLNITVPLAKNGRHAILSNLLLFAAVVATMRRRVMQL